MKEPKLFPKALPYLVVLLITGIVLFCFKNVQCRLAGGWLLFISASITILLRFSDAVIEIINKEDSPIHTDQFKHSDHE